VNEINKARVLKSDSGKHVTKRGFVVHKAREAEEIVKIVRGRGFSMGVIDPNVDPDDYQWSLSGDDVWLILIEAQDEEYRGKLTSKLILEGARSVFVSERDGTAYLLVKPRLH